MKILDIEKAELIKSAVGRRKHPQCVFEDANPSGFIIRPADSVKGRELFSPDFIMVADKKSTALDILNEWNGKFYAIEAGL